MNPTQFDELRAALETDGPESAIAKLCAGLREAKDYHRLFYALLLKKRHELARPRAQDSIITIRGDADSQHERTFGTNSC